MAHSSTHDGTKALPDVHDTGKDLPQTMYDFSMLKHARYGETVFDQKCSRACTPGWEYIVEHESDWTVARDDSCV